jgi:hypothetical protein
LEIDVSQALKDTENALRDFISSVLSNKFGANWIEQCGVTPERIKKWEESKAVEEKRQKFGVVEERLIYYAEFYDLKTILHKHWAEFADALGDKKTMEVWLDELGRLRDPDAHRRELLPYQKHLAVGISGEIRTRLVRYRSKQETHEDYFPRIESARDNYGNIITGDTSHLKAIFTKITLRPNDIIEIVITASDPFGEIIEYGIAINRNFPIKWQKENVFSVRILESYIGRNFNICCYIRSLREYHASGGYDDYVDFFYDVLPLKKN